jgi:hypothetical protein
MTPSFKEMLDLNKIECRFSNGGKRKIYVNAIKVLPKVGRPRFSEEEKIKIRIIAGNLGYKNSVSECKNVRVYLKKDASGEYINLN